MLPRLLQRLQTTPLTSVGKYEVCHGLVTQNMKHIPSSLLALLAEGCRRVSPEVQSPGSPSPACRGMQMGFPQRAESRVSL